MPRITIDLTEEEAAQLAELVDGSDEAAVAATLLRAGLLLKRQWHIAAREQERDEQLFGPDEPWSDGYINYSTGKIEPSHGPD